MSVLHEDLIRWIRLDSVSFRCLRLDPGREFLSFSDDGVVLCPTRPNYMSMKIPHSTGFSGTLKESGSIPERDAAAVRIHFLRREQEENLATCCGVMLQLSRLFDDSTPEFKRTAVRQDLKSHIYRYLSK